MKKIRKLIPVSLYDIPGMERWLEEQAGQGLFPEQLGSWATFNREGKPGTRFRLDPYGKTGTEPDGEQLELYRQAGWEYALPIGRAYFLFYTTDPAAPELYSDYQSRGLSLDRLAKQVRRMKYSFLPVLIVFLLAALVFCFWPASRFDVQPDRWARPPLLLLTLTQPGFLLCLVCLFFLILPQQRRDCRTMDAHHKALKNGLPPPPSPGPSRKVRAEHLADLILAPLLVVVVAVPTFGNYFGLNFLPWDRLIPLDSFSQPYVALADLEDEPLYTYEALFGEPGHSQADENTAQRHFSLLAPVWYEVIENKNSAQAGTQTNAFSPDPQGGKYRYSPNLDATYFQLLLPALARPVAEAQLDAYRLVNIRWGYEEVSYPGVDFVILARDPESPWQMAALGNGGRVAVFRYAGVEQLADHLDALATMVR